MDAAIRTVITAFLEGEAHAFAEAGELLDSNGTGSNKSPKAAEIAQIQLRQVVRVRHHQRAVEDPQSHAGRVDSRRSSDTGLPKVSAAVFFVERHRVCNWSTAGNAGVPTGSQACGPLDFSLTVS